MQLNDLTENNLFNDLSDQEQEVVAGGTTVSGAWGTAEYGPGVYKYTSPSGKIANAQWTGNSFSFNGTTFSW